MTHEQQELSTDGVHKRELPQPRFDHETTLLSARPVVPLNRIRAYARSKRFARFVCALFTAGLLGALTAILLSNWNEVRSISIQEDSGASGAAATTAIPQSQPTVTKEIATSPPIEVKEPESVHQENRQTERNKTRERRRERQTELREQQRESRERQREARRRQRDEREETNDDLFRIREIFEGRLRPDQ